MIDVAMVSPIYYQIMLDGYTNYPSPNLRELEKSTTCPVSVIAVGWYMGW